MASTFEYRLGDDDRLYYKGKSNQYEPIETVFLNGITAAEAMARDDPALGFELYIRQLERIEYHDLEAFSHAESEYEDIMATISPIPDEVLAGSDIDGYDRKRKKAMVRIYKRTDGGMTATSLSLDLSDRDGLNAIAQLFGETIHDDETGMDIRARRFLKYSSEFKRNPATEVRQAYDKALATKYGGNWYVPTR
jgi:hypothetical protein